jgi:hypothetical protein
MEDIMPRALGLFALMPMTMLLTVSYFVLFANGKTDSPGLKSFGKVVVALLWIVAALALLGGIFVLATGHHMAWHGCMMQNIPNAPAIPPK